MQPAHPLGQDNFKPARFEWYPNPYNPLEEKNKFLPFYTIPIADKIPLWKCIESLTPPILDKRYYTINTNDLNENSKNCDYMGVATWYALWNESFGCQMMGNVNKLWERIHSDSKIATNFNNVTDFLRTIHKQYNHSNNANACHKSDEFILEPCILIQIPWKPVIYHQWLIAVYMEILTIEKETTEFKHLSVPLLRFPYVAMILNLIRNLKDRIYFGFMLLYKQIKSGANHAIAKCITTEVIFKSVPTIKFLLSGKAYEIIKCLKKESYDEISHKAQFILPVSVESYEPIAVLKEDFKYQAYSCIPWEQVKGSSVFAPRRFAPFDMPQSESNMNKIIEKLKYKCFQETKGKEDSKDLNDIELSFLDKVPNLEFPPEMAISMIQNCAQRRVFPKFVHETVEKTFKEKYDERRARDPTDKEPHACAVRRTMIIRGLRMYIMHAFNEKSFLSRIVIAQLVNTLDEQLTRLTSDCTTIFNIEPVIRVKGETMDLDTSIAILTDLEKVLQEKNKSVSTLFTDLPSEWKKGLKKVEKLPNVKSEINVIIKLFETRIGKLVYNSYWHAYNIGEPFPESQIVQYVIPSFIASFITFVQKNNSELYKNNFIKFLHGMLIYYETKFNSWLEKKEKTIDTCNNSLSLSQFVEYKLVIQSLSEKLSVTLESYLGEVPGLRNFLKSITLPDLQKNATNSTLLWDLGVSVTLWLHFSYKILTEILEVCKQVFNPPMPGSFIVSDNVTQLYLAQSVVNELCNICEISKIHHDKKLKIMSVPPQIRTALLKSIIGVPLTADVIKIQRQMLETIYNSVKKFRQSSSEIHIGNLERFLNPLPSISKKSIELFLDSKFDKLEVLIQIFGIKKCKDCNTTLSDEFICDVNSKLVDYYCSDDCKQVFLTKVNNIQHVDTSLTNMSLN